MNEEYEYENLVKGYEKTIEAQADMINRQQHFIKWLLVTFSSIIGSLCVVMIVFVSSYFWSPYDYMSNSNNTNISGDENKLVNDNTLQDADISEN